MTDPLLMSHDGFDIGPDPDGEIGALAALGEAELYAQLIDRSGRLVWAQGALLYIVDRASHGMADPAAALADVLAVARRGLGEEGGS